ncbi:HEAT repeat domain-containing protein [Saltatorellus ferox]
MAHPALLALAVTLFSLAPAGPSRSAAVPNAYVSAPGGSVSSSALRGSVYSSALGGSVYSSAPGARGAADDTVRDFKKYFRKLKDSASRQEAVLTLLDVEAPDVVDALVPLLGDKDPEVARAAARVLSSFKERPPIDRLIAAFEEEKKDDVRIGLLQAMRDGGYKGLGEVVVESLQDRNWAIRRLCVLALAAGGDPAVAPSIAPLAEDEEPAVRCAVIDGLASLKAKDEALAAARAHLADEVWQVRASAISALGSVRDRDSIPLLIERLGLEEGRLISDVGESLDNLTGRTFGTRLKQWQSFWEAYGDRYQIPSDEELAKLRATQAERRKTYGAGGGTSFHGVETPSRSLLFVIDVSGSMEDLVVEKERFEGANYPSWARMDIVKTELASTIESLEPHVNFGIIAFATKTKRWKKTLVPANVINKESALDFVKRLEPLGGNSKADLAEVGLGAAANLGAGKTNTYGALSLALGLEDGGSHVKQDYLGEVDTIFFLSDGRPTHGKYIEPKEIGERITEANALRKVVLHTIAIGNFDKSFMKGLAENNGGVFVDLGK